jgi:predicted Zn-dependent protease
MTIKRFFLVGAASTIAGLVALHLACKQDGSGPDLSVFKQVAGSAGSAVGIDSRITSTAVAAVDYMGKTNINAETEDGMGQSVAVSMTNTYPLTKDVALNKYVSLVGLTVVNASDRPVGNWQFGVLETTDVNAFAGPNGYIFVTRGALNRMDNEAQLAGVLAHEVTHVLHHHGIEAVKASETTDFFKTLADINVRDATGTAQMVNHLAGPTVTTVAKNGYGQGQENDADANAIKLMVAAGYDPHAFPQFLQKLQSAGGGLFSTHPGKPERIAKTNQQIASLGNPGGKTLEARFKKNLTTR